jgi:hypothetical protein
MVWFSDDSAAKMEGCGKVELVCRNGERQIFSGVFYIPKLSANIINIGCLDEDGFHVVISSGELVIREPGGRMLARVKWIVNPLYLLLMTLSAIAAWCLVTRGEAEAWRWPKCLSHLNFLALKKMAREELV